ncbi:MAG: hypothetical protein S4CHLAM37_04830 [Chlamydiia bacterium]|nr:hypothetical protein [Chlamydiia bacterium]
MPKSLEKIKTVQGFNKHTRRLRVLLFALKYPGKLKSVIKSNISALYEHGHYLQELAIPTVSQAEIIDTNLPVKLQNYAVRNGNVSYLELLTISSIVAILCPKNLLEIGTFDGNTTLQLALNAPDGSSVHTLDLPDGGMAMDDEMLSDDVQYVTDAQKKSRKYVSTQVEDKITQHFGDSRSYDFGKFMESGPVDFCFIDAGHSYSCVKNDTEKAFKVLSPGGTVLWHDYNPNCPGVYNYLNELAARKELKRIEDTSLVICSGDKNS